MAKRWTFDEGQSEENTLCLASAALGPWSPLPSPILWLSKPTHVARAFCLRAIPLCQRQQLHLGQRQHQQREAGYHSVGEGRFHRAGEEIDDS
jgi:hypothetical protein